MTNDKVTYIQAMDFFRKFNAGEFPRLRLGQAFVMAFNIDCDWWHPEYCLHREEDAVKAARYIWETLVIWETPVDSH